MASGRDNTGSAAQNSLGRVVTFSRTTDGDRRNVVGIIVSSGCRRLTAAMITVVGRGLDCRVEQSSHLTQPLDDDVRRLYRDLVKGRELRPAARARLATRLAEGQAELFARLVDDGHGRGQNPLAVGIHDPGMWDLSSGQRSYGSLCDAALLAESTGHCIIDGFPARDVACGGLGGPLLAVPLWMLLHDPNQPRVLVDLGRSVRATSLPPGDSDATRRVVSAGMGTVKSSQYCPSG